MPRITVDFSEVEEFEAVPKDEYPVIISDAEFREFPEEPDRHPYINVEMEIADGEYKGRKLWMILSFSPKALWRMKQVFENLDIYMDELDIDVDDETNKVTSPELVGLPAVAAVSTRIYEGRTQNQVDALTGPDGNKKRSPAKKASGPRAKQKAKATAGKKKFQ